MKNIALIGPMYAGKDTVANFFVDCCGYRRVAFADPLKEEVTVALNVADPEGHWTPERLETEKARFRPLFQWWGTEFRRQGNPDYWLEKIKLVMNTITTPLVCTDARFINELDFLKSRNFLVIRLNPEPSLVSRVARARGLSMTEIAARSAHVSEQEWRSVVPDLQFNNKYGDMPNLAAIIASLVGVAPEIVSKTRDYYANLSENPIPDTIPTRIV